MRDTSAYTGDNAGTAAAAAATLLFASGPAAAEAPAPSFSHVFAPGAADEGLLTYAYEISSTEEVRRD